MMVSYRELEVNAMDEKDLIPEELQPEPENGLQDEPREESQEGAQTEPPEKAPEEKGSFKLDLYFWVQALAMALIFLILTFTLLGRVIRVEGSSMLPTLHENDLMLLQSIAYTPKQGDVVVLRKSSLLSVPIVKRVIAVGGQHVTVDYADHCVYVDGVALDEPYINELMRDPLSPMLTVLDVDVPEGSIYVMGDNRNHSSDSRDERLGTVDTRYVLGRAFWVLVPFDHFGAIE